MDRPTGKRGARGVEQQRGGDGGAWERRGVWVQTDNVERVGDGVTKVGRAGNIWGITFSEAGLAVFNEPALRAGATGEVMQRAASCGSWSRVCGSNYITLQRLPEGAGRALVD